MTIYLQIRSDARHSRAVPTPWLVEALAGWPELQVADAPWARFHIVREGAARATLQGVACSAAGNYAIREGDPPPGQVNLLELRFGYEENLHARWYESLAMRLAQLLDWEAWGEDDEGRAVQLRLA